MHHPQRFALFLVACTTSFTVWAVDPSSRALAIGIEELRATGAEQTIVKIHPATGTPSLVRAPEGALIIDGPTAGPKAAAYFEKFSASYGLENAGRDLELVSEQTDRYGMARVTFAQTHRGLPVFGALVRAHFDPNGELRTVNGVVVPDLKLDVRPLVDSDRATALARAVVAKEHRLEAADLRIEPPVLMVYRTGLARGLPGTNHLVWEIELSARASIHESLFIDAHDGRLVDRLSRIHTITRRIHDERYPNAIWSEGDPLPYSGFANANLNDEANRIIDTSLETYDFFLNLTGGDYESYDGNDADMNSVVNWDYDECPNASWNNRETNYCEGLAVDDVIGHEWTHAYTGATHDLIYAWQPGAINEAYSDIFGEVIDLLNGTGLDSPNALRSDGECTSAQIFPAGANLEIAAPQSAVAAYTVWRAQFNPPSPWSVTASVELANDGTGATADACEPLVGFTVGNIALIDRGDCDFVDKVQRAADAGAVGAIVANNADDGLRYMGSDPPTELDIPSVFVTKNDGDLIKAGLAGGLGATMWHGQTVQTVRWLIAEDSSASELGVFRDMWSPGCLGDGSRITGARYWCSEGDEGGVHHNSGIPNHAFALLVDGGSHNGRTVQGIGLTKASHIYWRSMSVYQVPTTGFADHADAVELSCSDLIDQQLTDIQTGNASPERISAIDCQQVELAMEAVEMRSDFNQCGFEPVLENPAPPVLLDHTVYEEDFEVDPSGRWTFTNEGVFPDYNPRDWRWTHNLPDDRDGSGLQAVNNSFIGDCVNDDQSGVQRVESPEVTLPDWTRSAMLVFDHYVAVEKGWDGGNLKISVNGGAYQLVDAADFNFNPYNSTIFDVEDVDGEAVENTNPLAGQPGYTGVDEGQLDGSWGQSQVHLMGIASAGDTIRVRFDLGVDGCTGEMGWYLDNFKVVTNPETLQVRRPSRLVMP